MEPLNTDSEHVALDLEVVNTVSEPVAIDSKAVNTDYESLAMDIEPVNADSEPEYASSEYTNTDPMPNGTVGTETHCSDEYPYYCRLTIIQSGGGGNDEIEREHVTVVFNLKWNTVFRF